MEENDSESSFRTSTNKGELYFSSPSKSSLTSSPIRAWGVVETLSGFPTMMGDVVAFSVVSRFFLNIVAQAPDEGMSPIFET
jgi:hypothetical protein